MNESLSSSASRSGEVDESDEFVTFDRRRCLRGRAVVGAIVVVFRVFPLVGCIAERGRASCDDDDAPASVSALLAPLVFRWRAVVPSLPGQEQAEASLERTTIGKRGRVVPAYDA